MNRQHPLLNWQDLPQFDLIKPELLAQAVDLGIDFANQSIKEAEQAQNLNFFQIRTQLTRAF